MKTLPLSKSVTSKEAKGVSFKIEPNENDCVTN